MSRLPLSVIIVAYNMARELPRTIRSLSPLLQHDIGAADYELIVVDNGSNPPFDPASCAHWYADLKVHRMQAPSASPVGAINAGLALASGELVGVFVDGARLASPRLLQGALDAARLHRRPVIGALGFHLGPTLQRESMKTGYDQAYEDKLLSSVRWTEDPYRLFSISSLGGSYKDGWFMPIAESNSVFLTRNHWTELGGYDTRFTMPGGGLANLDLWRRAVLSPQSQVFLLLGEGTFHQIHGGAATNAARPMYPEFDAEYRSIRGLAYEPPAISPIYLGRVPPASLEKLAWSAAHAQERRTELAD